MEQQETVVGAAVRAHLREVLDAGPLTERGVDRMLQIVCRSLPLIQTIMGAKNNGLFGSPYAQDDVVAAGVPTFLGIIPLDEWSESRGYLGDAAHGLQYVGVIARVVVNRIKKKIVGEAWEHARIDASPDLDAALRARITALLDRPYTPPAAKRLERLLQATLDVLRALGPTQDRASRGRRRKKPGVIGATYIPLPGETLAGQMPVDGEWGVPMPNPGVIEDVDEAAEADAESGPLVSSPPAETFGAKIFREIMAMAPALMNAQRNTPENMVLAIVAAEREGMPKLAEKLRRLMGLEKPDEQETPKPKFVGLAPPNLDALWKDSPPLCSFVVERSAAGDIPGGVVCGDRATRAAKGRNGFVYPYCDEHLESGLKDGAALTDCVGAPQCAVEGTMPGVGKDGLTRLYCEFHYSETSAGVECHEYLDGR